MGRRNWIPEEIEILTNLYGSTSAPEIAKRLDRTIASIENKAHTIGLKADTIWTREDYDYLEEHWGNYSIPTIAKNLNRSVNAVKAKAFQKGLSRHLHSGEEITLNQLIKALGIGNNYSTAKTTWLKRGFPIKYKKSISKKFKVVLIDDFWKWAEKNRSLIDWSKAEPGILGKEPAWVQRQRKIDFQTKIKFKTTPWTKVEDERLKYLVKQFKYGYKELSKELGRSEGAINKRIVDLKLKERPVRAENHTKWTDEEYRQLGELIKQGFSYGLISDILGKSAKAIRGRVYYMYLTENLDKAAAIIGTGSWGDNRPERQIKQFNTMNTAERIVLRDEISKLMAVLKGQITKHYENSEYWQRKLCENWDNRCLAGQATCDFCESFVRIHPQYCRRCGVTFYKRTKADICDRCKISRKKQHQRKWMVMYGPNGKAEKELVRS